MDFRYNQYGIKQILLPEMECKKQYKILLFYELFRFFLCMWNIFCTFARNFLKDEASSLNYINVNQFGRYGTDSILSWPFVV